jgi:cytochrome c oxidase cbb3-type subunit 3
MRRAKQGFPTGAATGFAIPVLVLVAVLLSACGDPGQPGSGSAGRVSAPDSAGQGDMLAAGRAVYNFRCYFCHGYSGDAKTLAATYLSPPPADFTQVRADVLDVDRIKDALIHGRVGTAMKSFSEVLSADELDAVAHFVHVEFVQNRRRNTRYHTLENGWPNHDRYVDAFPFARGELALTVPAETLSTSLQRGRKLYLEGCVTCHDRGKPGGDSIAWDARPLSFPRFNYDHRNPEIDASTSATPYRLHDIRPKLDKATAQEHAGESLFQENCAFCHAADGTGKNWIGAFLEPHPRDLTDPGFMRGMTRQRLRGTIADGLDGTSMPAWKDVLSGEQIEALIAYINKAMHPLAD